MPRYGNQHPTSSFSLPYKVTFGDEAASIYAETTKTLLEWQVLLLRDMMAVNDDGLWTHTKIGYSVPRRNGKTEIVLARELYAITKAGERVLHTAHRTTTSHSSAVKLAAALDEMGYTEVLRLKKGEHYEKCYTFQKQLGLEVIKILDDGGGVVSFRTRSGKGGLGEGFDLLIVDEAQEYTIEHESALKYVVSDSQNPQTIMCGTPPTAVSSGTVFPTFRDDTLGQKNQDAMWAEWGVEQKTDCNDVEAWYLTNPSLGYILTERKIRTEIGGDEDSIIDFNIQRLGWWIKYNQKSAISEKEWCDLEVNEVPKAASGLCVGVKYGIDGTNVAVSIAFKSEDDRIFVEGIDCRAVRQNPDWIVAFIKKVNPASIVIDGANGQKLLEKALKDGGVKEKPIFPTSKEFILANALFERNLYDKVLCHKGQPALVQVASNCDKRTIGSSGGFGYKSLSPDIEIALLDSVILAQWAVSELKVKKKQVANY